MPLTFAAARLLCLGRVVFPYNLNHHLFFFFFSTTSSFSYSIRQTTIVTASFQQIFLPLHNVIVGEIFW